MNKRKNHVTIVDGRNLLWRNSDAFSELSAHVDGEEVNTGGMYGFVAALLRVKARYRGRVIIAWEGSNNFRYDLFPDYKKKRSEGERTPEQEELIQEVRASEGRLNELLSHAGVRQYYGVGCEADDVMGTIAMRCRQKNLNVTIYTGDSDLRQLARPGILIASPGRGRDVLYDAKAVKERHGVRPERLPVLKALAGDSSDCQPSGTSVMVGKWQGVQGAGGKLIYHSVPIESVKAWDRVLSYDVRAGEWSSQDVLKRKSFRYRGDLITVKTESGIVSKYTPNHRCLVRTNGFDRKHFVYLMRRGDWFRVGVSTSKWMPGRMKDEGADSAWILSVHDTREEALLKEALVSHRYSIPDVRFEDDSSDWIRHFWALAEFDEGKIDQCLREHGRELGHPFYEKGLDGLNRVYGNRISEVRACNLISGMSVVIEGKQVGERRSRHSWERIEAGREWYDGEVHSLSVDRNGNYVADRILTHNSIPGLPGIGEKTAAQLVALYGSLPSINTAASFGTFHDMEALSGGDDWPVAERFKKIVWEGREQTKLFLELTKIRTNVKLKPVPVDQDKKEVIRLLNLYKFRSLSSASELLEIMGLGS